jgi:hypothetical protein
MTGTPRYKGFPLDLPGGTLTVPAMSAGTLEDLEDRINALQSGNEPKPMQLVVELLHRCLRRNYPDLPVDPIRDHVDLNNWPELLAMVMGESGYRQWVELEAAAGNARALQIQATLTTTAPAGTGAPSMPTSPIPSDGPSSTAESTSP